MLRVPGDIKIAIDVREKEIGGKLSAGVGYETSLRRVFKRIIQCACIILCKLLGEYF